MTLSRYDHPMKLSIVSPVYNVAPYLRDFFRSVERQDLGFRRNIQLVLVDDGSTDGSGPICDEFARRHPDNVVVLHQGNSGQAVARRAGLARATGSIVNFCDPDDILSSNACRKAVEMLDAHPEVDVAAIPLFFFGAKRGPHNLNNKFKDGTRVANLAEEFGVGVMSLPSTFVRRAALSDFDADPDLVVAEDAKELFRILLANPRLALVADAAYRYRRYATSTMSSSKKKPECYLPVLEHFTEWAISESRRRYGRLLPFVEYTLLYDLSWKFGNPPPGVLPEETAELYRNRRLEVLKSFSDEAIRDHERLNVFYKLFLLSQKQSAPPRLSVDAGSSSPVVVFANGFQFADNPLRCTIFKMDVEPSGCIVHALLKIPAIAGLPEPALVARCEGRETVFGRTGGHPDSMLLGRPVARSFYVSALVPFSRESGLEVSFFVRFAGLPDIPVPIKYANFAPITHRVPRSFFRQGRRLLRPTPGGYRVSRGSFFSHLASELAFDWSVLRRRDWGEKAAICFRWAYYLLKPFSPRRVWLVTDLMNRADDNGLALFEYLVAHRKELGIRPKFVLHPNSPDWKKVRAIGPVVPFAPVRYRFASLLSEWTVSSYFDAFVRRPFLGRHYLYNDLFHHNRFAFLQHGITKNDMSSMFNRYAKDFSVLVTASPRERDAILSRETYDYTEKEVVLTGFPRFDKLRDKAEKIVTFMFTWRKQLVGPADPATGHRPLVPDFEQSGWYQTLKKTLTSRKLLDEAQKLGYRIRFLLHHALESHEDRLQFDPRVEILSPARTNYSEIYMTSALCVTDYSSAVFDFAYLGKPVVYCQTDENSLENHLDPGYFDYEQDGFGPVARTTDILVDILVSAMHEGCPMKEPYKSRADSFFAFRDRNNCKRVAEAILAADARLRTSEGS